MDIYDRYAHANFKNPRNQPRPWDRANRALGRSSKSRDEVIALLKRAREGRMQMREVGNG